MLCVSAQIKQNGRCCYKSVQIKQKDNLFNQIMVQEGGQGGLKVAELVWSIRESGSAFHSLTVRVKKLNLYTFEELPRFLLTKQYGSVPPSDGIA